MDFTVPSLTGFPTQLSILFQWLLINPSIMKKVQNEIDSVVGRGRLPVLDDLKNLPYTDACIREAMRATSIVPSNVFHMTVEDTELMGYSVSKHTPIITSLYALHSDENVWKDPENFRPERFLGANGKLCLSLDKSLPFGAGKRLCPGETFSRNLMFLMFAGLAQNINIELKEGDNYTHPKDNPSGFITIPDNFWIRYKIR